jgi:hypothetical protein
LSDSPVWHIASVHTGREAGRLLLVALIDQLSVVQRILRHLGLPTDVPDATHGSVEFCKCTLTPLEKAGANARTTD